MKTKDSVITVQKIEEVLSHFPKDFSEGPLTWLSDKGKDQKIYIRTCSFDVGHQIGIRFSPYPSAEVVHKSAEVEDAKTFLRLHIKFAELNIQEIREIAEKP